MLDTSRPALPFGRSRRSISNSWPAAVRADSQVDMRCDSIA